MATRNDNDQVFVDGVAQASSPLVRDVTVEMNYLSIMAKANAALTANATFQAIASPTQAQTLAQVKALTKEVNALIRILLNQLSDVSDT